MTSPTDITKKVRRAKKSSMGKDRKNAVRRNGTTPVLFTLNKPTPNESK